MAIVAALQLAPVLGDFEGNRLKAATAIREALTAGADLIVLPELATSGYVFETVDELRAVAIPRDHEIFTEWAALAASRAGTVIVGGFAESGDDSELFNSAAMVDADGVRTVYRKVHLWDQEKRYFTPGNEAPPVVQTSHGRVGVMICFDLEFPEWTRIAALGGADILAVPTNWPYMERPAGERVAEVQIAMAMARINHMAIVCADRSGIERGVAWNEGSSIISADGWVIAAVGPGVGATFATVDPRLSTDKWLAPLAHAFDDRRPDLYKKFTPAK
ncbi:nitrilase-related carbon-nitrogen hydrolase [Glaciihabitans sp. UYNi722]|uniref:nitrilase-related carbon-nitrogen hydrolase n=1 Tax=Glaciihabitans sp. UYNi722 TaxID=3156344 RepID=UPI0033923A3F